MAPLIGSKLEYWQRDIFRDQVLTTKTFNYLIKLTTVQFIFRVTLAHNWPLK